LTRKWRSRRWLVRRRVAKQQAERVRGDTALLARVLQLALNVAWSAAFFGRRSPALGLAVIALLWGAIAATAVLAARVTRLAGLLLVPYPAWTSFAAALNFRTSQLNRSASRTRPR
jgi:translocator protein